MEDPLSRVTYTGEKNAVSIEKGFRRSRPEACVLFIYRHKYSHHCNELAHTIHSNFAVFRLLKPDLTTGPAVFKSAKELASDTECVLHRWTNFSWAGILEVSKLARYPQKWHIHKNAVPTVHSVLGFLMLDLKEILDISKNIQYALSFCRCQLSYWNLWSQWPSFDCDCSYWL